MLPTDDLLEGVQTLAAIAATDVSNLFRTSATADEVRDDLLLVMPILAETYGSAAATVTADWYEDARETAGLGNGFRAIVADAPDIAAVEAHVRWSVSSLYQARPDRALAAAKLAGGLQRFIVDQSRGTIRRSTIADPSAIGWQRQTTGKSCGFCVMLSSRGAVYRESTVDFASHDDCDCIAVPAFDGTPRQVKPFTPSLRQATPADRARVRAYLARNSAG
jgi:hypothetical protein